MGWFWTGVAFSAAYGIITGFVAVWLAGKLPAMRLARDAARWDTQKHPGGTWVDAPEAIPRIGGNMAPLTNEQLDQSDVKTLVAEVRRLRSCLTPIINHGGPPNIEIDWSEITDKHLESYIEALLQSYIEALTKPVEFPVNYIDWRDQVERAIPGAQIEVDNYGQIVIYTGLIQDGPKVVEMTDDMFNDEDDGG